MHKNNFNKINSKFHFQSFIVAIAVPDAEVLEAWAQKNGIEGDIKQLCQNEVTKSKLYQRYQIVRKGYPTLTFVHAYRYEFNFSISVEFLVANALVFKSFCPEDWTPYTSALKILSDLRRHASLVCAGTNIRFFTNLLKHTFSFFF